MTESEWCGIVDFGVFLEACMWLREDVKNHRKLRLWSCACCHRLGSLLNDKRSLNAIEVAERFADGLADKGEVRQAKKAAAMVRQVRQKVTGTAAEWAASAAHILLFGLEESAQTSPIRAAIALRESGATTKDDEYQLQFELLRDVFGNPFRTVAFDPMWRTSHAVSLAASMYDGRDFSTMPVLADALQEAGCKDEAIQKHCRSAGPHVKGCWVVDLVLEKC